MLKSSLFILFCKTDADFHQMATFILWLDVYSRHTVSFLDLTYSCRTLFYDTFDMTLLHLILVTAPNVVTLAELGCIEIFGLLVFTRLLIGYYVS